MKRIVYTFLALILGFGMVQVLFGKQMTVRYQAPKNETAIRTTATPNNTQVSIKQMKQTMESYNTATPAISDLPITPTKKKTVTFAPTPSVQTSGSCVTLPILMYHHVADKETANKGGYSSLNVLPEMFAKQMKYLKENGYKTVSPDELESILSQKIKPGKFVMITFDDGYQDNFTNAWRVLRDNGQVAVIFLPTGLMNNPGYLSWDEVYKMRDSGVMYFGNHTWSHLNVASKKDKVINEITLADNQLVEKGLDVVKFFAYPYGIESSTAKETLKKLGYKMAVTTKNGKKLCFDQPYDLPRIRVGNANLDSYGI